MATREQMIAEIRAMQAQQAKTPSREQMIAEIKSMQPQQEKDAWYQDLGEGIGLSALETGYGIKDLVTGLTEEEEARLADWRQDAGESGWGTFGQVVGEVGQAFIPGAAVAKGLKLATKAKKLGGAGQLFSDVIGSGAMGAVQMPEYNEDRQENALQGMIGAAVGGGFGTAASKLLRGLPRSKASEEAAKLGISSQTLGQAADSRLGKLSDLITSNNSLTAGAFQEKISRGLNQFNRAAIKEVSPPGKTIAGIGREADKALFNEFKDSYSKAWKKAHRPSQKGFADIKTEIARAAQGLDDRSKSTLRGIFNDIESLENTWTPQKMEQLDKRLKGEISSANNKYNPNKPLSDALKGVRGKFREAISPQAKQELQAIDKQYSKYSGLRKAIASSVKSGHEGVVLPEGLLRYGYGNDAMERLGEIGLKTIGELPPRPFLSERRALIEALPSFGVGGGSKLGLGETGTQKLFKKYYESPFGSAARSLASLGKISGALAN